MQKPHLEVPLNILLDDGVRTQAVLANLPDGKAYQSAPDKRLPQLSQKGPVCWYYALNHIRMRYGKHHRNNANRHVERCVSAYRKAESESYLNSELAKLVVQGALTYLGQKQLQISDIDQLLKSDFVTKDEWAMFEKAGGHINCFLDDVYKIVGDSEQLEQRVAQFTNNIEDTLLGDLKKDDGEFVVESIRRNKQNKKSFHGALFAMWSFFGDIVTSDELGAKVNKRIFLLYLSMYSQFSKTSGNLVQLSFTEFFELFACLASLNALETLMAQLDVKLDRQCFDGLLTDGVHNLTARVVMLSQSKRMYQAMKQNKVSLSSYLMGPLSAPEDLAMAKSFHACYFVATYRRIIELYDLNVSPWHPDQGFDGLMKTIDREGALVVHGHAIGLPAYTEKPRQLQQNGEPLLIGSRNILFWRNEALKPKVSEDNSECGHAITIIGARSFTDGKQLSEQYVLFLDPNDQSIPGQERTVYQMPYELLIERLAAHNKPTFTNGYFPEDGVYAVSAPRP